MSDEHLSGELQKPTIRKFKKRKLHSPFTDNIWGADLTDIQLIFIQIVFSYVLLMFLVNTHDLFL